MSKLSEFGAHNEDFPAFEVISTHLGVVLRFRDKESVQYVIDGLQNIIDNNESGPPYLHISYNQGNPEDAWKYLDWYTDMLKYERSGLK